MFIYIKTVLSYHVVKLKSKYCRYCCIKVACGNTDKMLITSIYRSPTSTEQNNMDLLNLISKINARTEKQKVLVGDFNLPHINWNNYTSATGTTNINALFTEAVRGCFLTQHVNEVTRIRGEAAGSTLDFVFTNDESIIEEVKVQKSTG